MSVLKANTITKAKLGNTDLSAVYRGDTQIWQAKPVVPEFTLSSTYWGTVNEAIGTKPLMFSGIHNMRDPDMQYQFYASSSGSWLNVTPNKDQQGWGVVSFPPDVTFNIASAMSGAPHLVSPYPGKIRYKLSDGTITEWAYSP
jgi:hypothetical protein